MDSIPLRHCNKCGNDWPPTLDYFFADPRRGSGFRSPCKQCIKDYRQIPKQKAAIQTSRKRHYAANSEKIKQYVRMHRQANKKRISQQRRQFREANKERLGLISLRYRNANRVTIRQRYREYSKSHREVRRTNEHNREARKRNIPGKHTPEQIQDLLKRQKGKCYYCRKKFEKRNGKYVYQIEHTFPISRVAGTDIPANDISYLVLACPKCNDTKKNKYPWEWPEGGRLL